ncbi:hypothetical protein M422DRAFT_241464 [Sphaerobolus stellatus SS14]|nr:hypothetical protein M422DRAFT_241464 [Sphaerobolus stellatus SS14]
MDPSWCPGCDRLILPKRVVVSVDPTPAPASASPESSDSEYHPPPPPAPTPVPSSPEVRRRPVDQHTSRPARRLGGGLVHGTGRVRPGGGLRSDNRRRQFPVVEAPAPTPTPAPAPAPAPTPKKTRVVISQEPTPLYCSEECRIRDLKNSFLESEVAGFAAAPAAFNRANQLELVQETIRRLKSCRPASPSRSHHSQSSSPSTSPETPSTSDSYPLTTPPVPPNSLIDTRPIFRTNSMSSCGTSTSYTESVSPKDDEATIRVPKRRSHPPRVPSWGSPTKSTPAPPRKTLFNASSSSLDSLAFSANTLFDEPVTYTSTRTQDSSTTLSDETNSTNTSSPHKNGKKKRVSFASDSKPAPAPSPLSLPRSRPKNPLLEANPVRAALSLSPKDRLVKPSSLPTRTNSASNTSKAPSTSRAPTQYSKSSPDLARYAATNSSLPPKNPYGVAMWPEDEKRCTPATHVHGNLLRGYAKKFAPREGRSLVFSQLWAGLEADAKQHKLRRDGSADSLLEENEREELEGQMEHEEIDDGERDYWRSYEERERERKAKRRAEEEVRKMEEARVIREMLGGVGCSEADQPQARKMGKIAYDGMPGPAENRGLKYEFNQFLYDLVPPKQRIVEHAVKRWDPNTQAFVDDVRREVVYEERKRLFNFED